MIKLSMVQLDQIRDILDWNSRNANIKKALEVIKVKTENVVFDQQQKNSDKELIDLLASVNNFIFSIDQANRLNTFI